MWKPLTAGLCPPGSRQDPGRWGQLAAQAEGRCAHPCVGTVAGVGPGGCGEPRRGVGGVGVGSRPPATKPVPCGIGHVAASPDLSPSFWTRAESQAQSCPLLEMGRFPRENGGARGWPGQERSGKSRPWGWVWGLASSRSCGSPAPPPDPASCSLLWGTSTSSPPAGVLAHVTIY